MRSLLNFHMRQLEDGFFTEESKECIAPRDGLLSQKEYRLHKYYMMFAGLTASKLHLEAVVESLGCGK